jgi:hypothetical protein
MYQYHGIQEITRYTSYMRLQSGATSKYPILQSHRSPPQTRSAGTAVSMFAPFAQEMLLSKIINP